MNSISKPIALKVLTLGNSEAGKSCLIKRFCEKRFVPQYLPTIGIDYGVINSVLRNKELKVNIFDASGDPLFLEVRNEFYRDCDGVLLVFDVTNRKSFDALDHWIYEMKSELGALSGPFTVRFCVCGNKVDLAQRVVSYFEASQWCANNNLPYFETSALTGHGVIDVINTLLESVVEPDVSERFVPLHARNLYRPNGAPARSEPPQTRDLKTNTAQKHSANPETPRRVGRKSAAPPHSNRTNSYTQHQIQAVIRIKQAKTHQDRLGVRSSATKEEINRAYRKLAFNLHPDKNFAPGSEDAFKLLVAARTALLQPEFHSFNPQFHSAF